MNSNTRALQPSDQHDMRANIRKSLHLFIPQQFHDPFGLLIRLIRSRDRAAWFAMETALLGLLCTPLDLLLQIKERSLYQNAPKPAYPLIFVCGAPRTGTTLVTQVLINYLPVGYLNNLTSIFPRSPIAANLLFQKMLKSTKLSYTSYYGKSISFSGPNDALYIWDRWFGKDRTRIRTSLTGSEKTAMVQFFGAYQQVYQRPLLNKNNNLNTQANLVADVFENAHFICMTREPQFLAQSLLKARLDIHGDINVAYGIHDPEHQIANDYIQDVCSQVLFHERMIHEQQRLIGPERFWIVPYEQFCNQPEELVARASGEILGRPGRVKEIRETLKPFSITNKVKMEAEVFEKVESTLARLRQEAGNPLINS